MAISGKHIVITGGASGLGLEMVKHLHETNIISVIARPSRGLEQFRQMFPAIHIYEADLGNLSQVEAAADHLVKDHDVVDILINNAAVQFTPTFLADEFSYHSIQREITVNLTAICSLTFLLLPALLNSRSGIILNINSGLGLVPKTSSAIYCATKGGLNIFSQSLRHQLETSGVRVKQAFLPLVETPMTEGRGSGKMPAQQAAADIIAGLAKSRDDIDIGKVRVLRPMSRFFPALARKIMKAA